MIIIYFLRYRSQFEGFKVHIFYIMLYKKVPTSLVLQRKKIHNFYQTTKSNIVGIYDRMQFIKVIIKFRYVLTTH